MTGMMDSTGGEASIYGMNIATHIDDIR